MKYFVWGAAVVFAMGIAFLAFVVAGFGGLGPTSWSDTLAKSVAGLAIGLGSQAGVALAPVARARGALLRAVVCVLMIPAFALGVSTYRDVFSGVEGNLRLSEHPWLAIFPAIVPVYVIVAVWMWRTPRPRTIPTGIELR